MKQEAKAKKLRSTRAAKAVDGVWTYAVLVLLVVIWVIPIVWIVAASFRGEKGLMSPTFFPETWTIVNYKNLFTVTHNILFGKWLGTTFMIAGINLVATTFITLCTAFALSRFRFKTRKPFMNVALILGMFPGFMAMVAVYIILNLLGLIGQVWALLLVYMAGAGLGFFVSKGYFDTLPVSLDEAAYIDGASQMRIFFRIILPLSKPIIIYTAMMAFMTPWTDYILAGLILTDPSQMTVAVGLYNMTLETRITSEFTMFAAGCIIVAVPIVALYLSLQKFMVEGISAGAVKG